MGCRLKFKIPLKRITVVMLAMSLVIPYISQSYAQTVDELVRYPPLVNIIQTNDWRYESEFLLNSAYNAIKTGDYQSADALVKKILEQRSDDPAVIQLLVHTSMHLKNWPDAEAHLKELTKIQPDNLTARLRLGFVHDQQKLFGLAADDYEQIMAQNPSPELSQYLSKALEQSKNNYETAAKKSAEEIASLISDGEAADSPEFWIQQVEIMDNFLSRNPEEPQALLARAEAGLNTGRHQAARKDFIGILNNPLATNYHPQAAGGLWRVEKQLLTNPSMAVAGAREVGPAELVRLENRLSRMIEKEPENGTLLFLRGSTRLRLGGDYARQGQVDLTDALNAQELSEEEVKLTKNLMENAYPREDGTQQAQFPAPEPDWNKIQEAEAALKGQSDKLGLEKYYTELAEQYPYFAYAHSARGYMRLGDGRLAEARADFIQAIRLESDPQLIATYEEMASEIEDRNKKARQELAATPSKPMVSLKNNYNHGSDSLGGTWTPTINPVERCLDQASKAQQAKHDQEFLALIAQIDRQTLSTVQSGRRDYLLAQHLWGQQEYDQAFNLYMRATEKLPRNFYMSDSYSRISSYYLMRGESQTALKYIKKSLDIMPDFSWHNIQAGNVYLALKDNEAAINYFLKAGTDQSIALPDRHFYSSMAWAYLGLNDRDSFDTYMRLHIDSDEERLALKDVATEEDIRNIHKTKKTFSDVSKKYGGHLFVFGNNYEGSDYYISFSSEVNRKLTIFDHRAEVYAKAGGILGSSFSGSYFNPWSGQDTRWVGKSKFDDDAYAGLGARYYPFSNSSLYFAFEQIFGLGRKKDNDSRLILSIFEAVGNEWEPIKSHWNFASFYGELTYSLSDTNFYNGSEGRFGHRFNLECFDRLVDITPFVGAVVVYDGENASKGARWGLEAGPGLIITKWFEEDDTYKVPTSSLDFVIQYRFGMSHDRDNLATATLYYSF